MTSPFLFPTALPLPETASAASPGNPLHEAIASTVDPAKTTGGTTNTAGTTAVFLQDLVLDSVDVDQFLNNLANTAAKYLVVPGQEMYCGVTLLRPNHAKTIASSSHAALKLDKIQYIFGDGPCLTAARSHELVHVRDTHSDDRWPDYLQEIIGQGIHSTLGVPIALEGDADCALNLYSNTIDGFTDDAIEAAQDFANEASRSLRLAVRIAHLCDKAENLTAALESRIVIDLAAGVIMGQNRCSQSEAIIIMKATASHRQIKVHVLATEVVASLRAEHPTTHFG